MMWLFKRRKIKYSQESKELEAEQIKAETLRRTDKATKPIMKLTKRFEQNGITMEIKRSLGGHHG